MQKERNGEFLPRRIKAARALAGLTVAELSQQTGMPTEKLYRFERGDQEPTVFEMAGIAAATGQPLGFFVEEETAA